MARGKKPASQRQLRVSEEIRRVIAGVLIKGDLFVKGLKPEHIMVTEVQIAPDFSHAYAYVRAIAGTDTDEQVALLNTSRGVFRKMIGQEIRLRIVPDVHFQSDTRLERAAEVDELLNQPRVKADIQKYEK